MKTDTRLIDSRINNSFPVAKEGIPFIVLFFILTLILIFFHLFFFSILMGILTAFVVYFFRDPERSIPYDPNSILCPADGKILKIEEIPEGSSPLSQPCSKVSIFMSIFDVHVNRVPVSGKVEGIIYRAGKFFSANLDKASEQNEKNSIILKTEDNKEVLLVQIAGLIARRIVCWVRPGDVVQAGQRFGLIRFGSRVELFLPEEIEVKVQPGQKVKAGVTIIGYKK